MPKKQTKKQTPQNNKKRFVFKMRLSLSRILIGILLFVLFLPFLITLFGAGSDTGKVDVSKALSDIKSGEVKEVVVQDNKLIVTYKDDKVKVATKEPTENFADLLQKEGVEPSSVNYRVVDQSLIKIIGDIAGIILPIILIGVFFYYIMRAQNKAAGDVFSFGRSRAKLFAKGKQDVTFSDVAGVDDAKKELMEVVDFLKNPSKYRKIGARTPKGVLLFGPAGVGKCVVGDTLVWTNKGLMEIKDIPKYFAVEDSGYVHGAKLSSLDPENPLSQQATASHWYDLGMSETRKVTTNMGHEIEGTLEHPIVVVNAEGRLEFKKMEDIEPKDWVPIKTGDQMFGNYRLLDIRTSYLLGLLTGDGGLTIKDRISFSSADHELVSSFKDYFKERTNSLVKKSNNRKYDYWLVSAKEKTRLINFGLEETYARNKRIPDYVMMSPKENIVAFLQGLFDTDGSVYKTGKVEYCTTSRRLAKQVSALLLNLGIMHKFRVKENNQYSDAYIILISGVNLLRFNEQIGFRLKRKQQKLEQYISKVKIRTNVDLLSNQGARIKRIWRYLVESGHTPSKYVSETFHKNICRYASGERKPSVESTKLFLSACEEANPLIYKNDDFRYLKMLVDAGLFFDQVKKVTKGRSRVYDFTVPKNHSFISNGFVSHNTLLARAVAGEANVPFFSMAGSEFMEMLVGVGASRVRDLFANAKASAPSIIFIDEIDAIGRQRGRGFVGGHDEREQTLNQILVEMDGFTPNDNVVVVAATNRGDLLDPALLRPGRFDRRVTLDMPDKEGRLAILKIHARGKKFAKGIKWGRIADRTVGFSGADLENMLNEAAIAAAREDKTAIDMSDIEEAATKVKLGPAKRKLQSDEDKKITAYHEAGHALVAHFMPKADPVQRISIVARGMSLGHTEITPVADRSHETKTRLLESIAVMLGGRAAEKSVFNEMTAGASNDIKNATRYAKAMVVDLGMSPLGPTNFGATSEMGEFGQMEWYEGPNISPAMQEKVDNEIKKIIDTELKVATDVIKKHRKLLDRVVDRLLEKETLDKDEFEEIVGTKKN